MTCDKCKGTGEIILSYDKFSHSSIICGKCSGTGKINVEQCKHNYLTLYCANTMSSTKAITITTYECHNCGKFKTIVSDRL